MVSMRLSGLAAATVLLSASPAAAAVNTVKPILTVGSLPGAIPSLFGCYGSSSGMVWAGDYNFMTSTICQIYCLNLGMPVLGTSAGTDCYCGQFAPPVTAKLESGKCSANCTGWGQEMCGGSNSTGGSVVLSIYNDQLESAISNAVVSSSSSATAKPTVAATATVPAVVTVTNAGGAVVTVMASDSASAQQSGASTSGGGGASKAGIAAGVVVGVIAIAGIAGGVWFFMRQKKRREVEEEHKRQVAVSSFISGGKPGSANSSVPDVRLDPAILRERRMSDGSIMDNQDYSRRILKVTNA